MIAEIIHKVAEMTQDEDHSFYPRPSMAGPDRCIRQMVYHGLGVEHKPWPGRAIIIFSDSSFHEDLTGDWIRKTAFQLHSEQMEVSCRPPMKKGSIDGILTDPLNIDRLFEHKAISHFTFDRYWSGSELPNDYFTQCAIYVDGIQQEANPELTEGVLLLKNKNTAQYMEFLFRYTFDVLEVISKTLSTNKTQQLGFKYENIVQNACEKFNQVLDYINRRTLPKRQYHINDDWQCGYCRWGAECWKNYETEFNELKTEAMLPNEVADMVRYYKELGAQKSDIEKECKNLRKKVKDFMIEAGAREGRAGEYLCRLKMIQTSKLDKTLLSPAEIEKATKKSFSEGLYISKIKEIAP